RRRVDPRRTGVFDRLYGDPGPAHRTAGPVMGHLAGPCRAAGPDRRFPGVPGRGIDRAALRRRMGADRLPARRGAAPPATWHAARPAGGAPSEGGAPTRWRGTVPGLSR